MKKLNNNDKDILRLSGFFALIIAVCIGAAVFLGAKNTELQNGAMKGQAEELMNLVSDAAKEFSAADEIASAVDNIAAKHYDGSHYWFVVSDNELVFEKNDETTALMNSYGDDLDAIAAYYVRAGASYESVSAYLSKLRSGNSFSVMLVKDKAYGRELICVDFAEVNGVRYSVGYAVRESYLLSSSGISKQILYYRILTAVLCGALVLIGGGFAVASFIRDRKIRHLNSELTAKNKLVEEQTTQIYNVTENSDSISGGVEGLYNDTFIHSFLHKLSDKNVQNVGVAAVKICDGLRVFLADGASGAKELMNKAAEAILSRTEKNDICARIRGDMILIVRLDTNEPSMMLLAGKIDTVLSAEGISFGVGAAMSDGDIYSAAAKAVEKADSKGQVS